MSNKKSNIIVVLELPNSDRFIIRASKKHVGVDRHARDRVLMASELRHVVVRPDVPDVHFFVATAHDHVPMTALLGRVDRRVLRVRIELKAKNL